MAVAIKRSDKRTALLKKQEHFSDFTRNFTMHPEKLDLTRVTNEHAVMQSLRNIIQTNLGERFFNYNFGGNLRKFLFEPIDKETQTIIEEQIRSTIANFEPRVKVKEVLVIGDEITSSYNISIIFSLINTSELLTVNLILTRVR